ncbi:PHO85 cyclin-5 [Umbelopsis sp. WA50703]
MTTSEYHQHAGSYAWEAGYGPHRLVDFPSHLSTDLHHYSLSSNQPLQQVTLHFTPVADQPPQRTHVSTIKSCKYSTPSKRQQEQHTPCQRPSTTANGYQHFMNNDRQERSKFVEKLIETTATVIESIWSNNNIANGRKEVIPTKSFIQEVLKRSKTTYSTLQTALFYLFRIKNIIVARLKQRANTCTKRTSEYSTDDYLCCGRRMFLASLMVASKYLQDKNYRNKAWAKISGLDIKEINGAETAFLKIIDYQLFISKPTFDRWFNLLNLHVDQMQQQQQQQQQQTAEETKPTRMYPTPTSSPVRHAPYRKPVQQHYPSPPNSIHEYENAGVSPAAASQLMFTLPDKVQYSPSDEEEIVSLALKPRTDEMTPPYAL